MKNGQMKIKYIQKMLDWQKQQQHKKKKINKMKQIKRQKYYNKNKIEFDYLCQILNKIYNYIKINLFNFKKDLYNFLWIILISLLFIIIILLLKIYKIFFFN